MRLVRQAAAGTLLVGVGMLLSPTAVPVYDGIGAPDEPYRYVVRPADAPVTAEPTSATGTSPVVNGLASYGLNVATKEVGPQFTVFLPPRALRATGTRLVVTVTPQATVTDPPADTRADGNAYLVAIDPAGATLTPQAALATVQVRATTAQQPPPTIQYRPSADQRWQALQTARAGTEIYAARFPGPGQFQVVFPPSPEGSGSSPLPLVVVGVLVVVGAVVLVVRLRAAG